MGAALRKDSPTDEVYCKVNSLYCYFSIAGSDLLMAFPTPRHTLKADDPARAFRRLISDE
jgi:hypothetical protein